jgi:hypothetical protein
MKKENSAQNSVIVGFPSRWLVFDPRSCAAFVVDEMAVGQVFFECFGFPCQLSFHHLLHVY